MKERIEELWNKFQYQSSGSQGDFESAINEALEMAAKGCERLRDNCTMHSDGGVCYEQACDDCAEAIRKLKV